MYDTADTAHESTNSESNPRISRRTLGLLAAAAAATTVGVSAMTVASGASEPLPVVQQQELTTIADAEESTLIRRGTTAIVDLFDGETETFVGENGWDDCPGCGMG